MKRITFGLATLLAAISIAACAPAGELTVNGDARPLTSVDAHIAPPLEDGRKHVNLEILSDPLPNAIDDELTINLDLSLADLDALALNEALAIDGDAIIATFAYSCFCTPADENAPTIEGTLLLREKSESAIKGEIDLRMSGKDANDIDLGVVELVMPFEAHTATGDS